MAIVDHESTAAPFPGHLDQLSPGDVSGEADLSAVTARPPPVGPRKLLVVQARPGLLQAIIVDDHLSPAVSVTRNNRAGQIIQPLAADDHHRLGLSQCSSGLTAGPAPIPHIPQILRPTNLFRQISRPAS